MRQYHDMLHHILDHGKIKGDRTGTGTISTFGYQMRFDLAEGFPLLTTKRVHFKSIVHELLWFLSGSTNIKYLKDTGVSIWDEWADENGELGPVYGKQWRTWDVPFGDPIDQIAKVIEQVKTNPNSRRLMVSAWNPADIDHMALPPCHYGFQLNVTDYQLSCLMTQRSADAFLGVPFNIASYALLTHMIAQVCGLEVGELIISFGDLHIYLNHMDQVTEQLHRECRPLPKLVMNPYITDIDKFSFDDIHLMGYDPHPAIKAPVSV